MHLNPDLDFVVAVDSIRVLDYYTITFFIALNCIEI